MGVGRYVGMQRRTDVGNARIAEEKELDVLAFRNLMQQVIEIPSDSGERLVERPDVHADAQPRFRSRRPP